MTAPGQLLLALDTRLVIAVGDLPADLAGSARRSPSPPGMRGAGDSRQGRDLGLTGAAKPPTRPARRLRPSLARCQCRWSWSPVPRRVSTVYSESTSIETRLTTTRSSLVHVPRTISAVRHLTQTLLEAHAQVRGRSRTDAVGSPRSCSCETRMVPSAEDQENPECSRSIQTVAYTDPGSRRRAGSTAHRRPSSASAVRRSGREKGRRSGGVCARSIVGPPTSVPALGPDAVPRLRGQTQSSSPQSPASPCAGSGSRRARPDP